MGKMAFLTGMLGLMIAVTSCSGSRKVAEKPPMVTQVMAIDSLLTNQLGRPVPKGANKVLVEEIAGWIGVPYQLGGNSKEGVDCSGFIGQVFPKVYNIRLPRTTAEMEATANRVAKSALEEGDLVFFTINANKPSHAGVYLWNGYFVHASTSNGVMVSSLSDKYWTKYFTSAGRYSKKAK